MDQMETDDRGVWQGFWLFGVSTRQTRSYSAERGNASRIGRALFV